MARSLAGALVAAVATIAFAALGRQPAREGDTGDEVVTLRAPVEGSALVRGGKFRMGSEVPEIVQAQHMCRDDRGGRDCDSTLFSDEMVAHDVTLHDFWIDRTEVTNRAYRRCVTAGSCQALTNAGALRWTAVDDEPATLVSWSDAERFCRWRGARLPSEAEWERAARGMSGRVYPWGNVYNPQIVNHGRLSLIDVDRLDDGDGFAELAPVASFVAGATREGVHDLAGNVAEWVSDWYARGYAEPDSVDPQGPPQGDFKVIRGGSYRDARAWLRGAARGKEIPSIAQPWLGFRCAKTATASQEP